MMRSSTILVESHPTSREAESSRRNFYPTSLIVLLVSWIGYIGDVFLRYNIPTAIPLLRKEYGWDALTVGWIDSAYLWTYALAQIPWAYVSERWLGAKWSIVISTSLMVFGGVLFAFHLESVWLAIFSRGLIGVGAAAIGVVLNPVLARWFAPSVRGLQVGLWATGAPIGTGLGGALMPILLTGSVTFFGLTALQTGFLYSALPGVVIVVLALLFIHNRPEDIGLRSLDRPQSSEPAEAATEPGYGYIMGHSPYPYIIAVVYSGFIGTKYFVWTWFAVFLASRYHLDPRSAGFIWAFVAAVPPVIMQPIAGWLSDRIGRVRCIVAALLCTTLLAGTLMAMSASGTDSAPIWVLVSIAGLFSIAANMWVLVWPLTTIMFPTSAGASVGATMNMFAQVVGATAPILSGYFIDLTGTYTVAFTAGAISSLLGVGCALFLKERRVV